MRSRTINSSFIAVQKDFNCLRLINFTRSNISKQYIERRPHIFHERPPLESLLFIETHATCNLVSSSTCALQSPRSVCNAPSTPPPSNRSSHLPDPGNLTPPPPPSNALSPSEPSAPPGHSCHSSRRTPHHNGITPNGATYTTASSCGGQHIVREDSAVRMSRAQEHAMGSLSRCRGMWMVGLLVMEVM